MTTPTRDRSGLFSILVGLASLGILLQGLWAGIVHPPGQAFDSTWVTVHARGAEVTIAPGAGRRRSSRSCGCGPRRDLVIGSAALVVLLALEAFIGGEVFDNQACRRAHPARAGPWAWPSEAAAPRPLSAGRLPTSRRGQHPAVGQGECPGAVAGDREGERTGEAGAAMFICSAPTLASVPSSAYGEAVGDRASSPPSSR